MDSLKIKETELKKTALIFKDPIDVQFNLLRQKMKQFSTELSLLEKEEVADETFNNSIKFQKEVHKALTNIWKLIDKIDKDQESLRFDVHLNDINRFKSEYIQALKKLLENLSLENGSTDLRNSTSTTESNLVNTRRETTQNDLECRNSVIFRNNFLIGPNVVHRTEKIKKAKDELRQVFSW